MLWEYAEHDLYIWIDWLYRSYSPAIYKSLKVATEAFRNIRNNARNNNKSNVLVIYIYNAGKQGRERL